MVMLIGRRHFKVIAILCWLALPGIASANLLQSAHYRLDPNVANTFGGSSSSSSYKLTDAGGESVVGSGASQSYKLTQGYISQLVHSLQLNVMPNGTYSDWPFDTGIGTQAYDVSTTNNSGTLVGAPTWTNGQIGKAIVLDGSTQYVSTATTQANPTSLGMEIWFKTTTTSGGRLIGFGDTKVGASTNSDRHIYMDNTGKLIFGANPGTKKTITSVLSFNDGIWHHAAATLGAAGMKLIVDGAVVASDGTATSAGAYTGYWRIGYDSLAGWPSAPTSSFFAGSIDQARVYTRELVEAEVKGNYISGKNGTNFAQTLPDITPGISQSYNTDAVIQTDAAGYSLYISSPQLLKHTDNITTIPAISATIAAPAAWNEGITKGLGFAVTSATQLEAKWGVGPFNYASLPTTPTVYHTRAGLNGGLAEKTTLQFRADTNPAQKHGAYSTTIIYSATIKP